MKTKMFLLGLICGLGAMTLFSRQKHRTFDVQTKALQTKIQTLHQQSQILQVEHEQTMDSIQQLSTTEIQSYFRTRYQPKDTLRF